MYLYHLSLSLSVLLSLASFYLYTCKLQLDRQMVLAAPVVSMLYLCIRLGTPFFLLYIANKNNSRKFSLKFILKMDDAIALDNKSYNKFKN